MNTAQRSQDESGARNIAFLVYQRGQSSMEYVVVCAAFAFALFVPIQDDPASPDQARTTVQIILDGFHMAYQNISHAISLPS